MKKPENKKFRFTWADRFLLIGLVVVLVGGIWFWQQRKQAVHPNLTVRYIVCVKNANKRLQMEELANAINVGATVKNANGTAVLGNVTDIRAVPHVEPTVKEGKLVFLNLQEHYDLYITVVGDAIQKEGDGTRIQDIRIAAGVLGDFHIGAFYAEGAQIVSVAEAEE